MAIQDNEAILTALKVTGIAKIFFQEMMPYVEKTYRIRTDRRYRAIAGPYPWCGGGLLHVCPASSRTFSAACPLSASVGPVLHGGGGYPMGKTVSRYFERRPEHLFHQAQCLGVGQFNAGYPEKRSGGTSTAVTMILNEGNCLVHIAMRRKRSLTNSGSEMAHTPGLTGVGSSADST